MVSITQIPSAIKWLAPSPLWGDQARWVRLPNQVLHDQPIILRFANDQFMEELMAMLTHAPWRLSEWIARPETWRKPMRSPAPILKTRTERNIALMYNKTKLVMQQQSVGQQSTMMMAAVQDSTLAYDQTRNNKDPIKLYQPSHQRYYLVTASLIADKAAYPDHLLDLSNNEFASYVVRAVAKRPVDNTFQKKTGKPKLDDTWYEYALVTTAFGQAWKELGRHQPESTALQRLVSGEEKLPLFPVTYQNHCGHNRQILAGTIPVSRREAWFAAPGAGDVEHAHIASPVLSHEGGITHIKEIFQSDVSEPWKALVEQAQSLKASIYSDADTFPSAPFSWDANKAKLDTARALKTARDQLQTGSWFVLLNFANFLDEFLPDIWDVIIGNKTRDDLKNTKQGDFCEMLEKTSMPISWYAQLVKENLAVGRVTTSGGLWAQLKTFFELEQELGITRWPDNTHTLLFQAAKQRNTITGILFYAKLQNFLSGLSQQTWYSLQDVVRHIEQTAPNVNILKAYVLGDVTYSELIRYPEAKAYYDTLDKVNVISTLVDAIGVSKVSNHNVTIETSLASALAHIKHYADSLERVDSPFERQSLPTDDIRTVPVDDRWPHFLCLLADADPELANVEESVLVPEFDDPDIRELTGLDKVIAMLDKMADVVDSMIPKEGLSAEATGQQNRLPLLDPDTTRFVVRCVFEKRNCGPLSPPVVSKASCQLDFAPFFDPDAPARPIRIPLPLDISPAGLRKYKKNTMFLISDMLCGKIKRMRKLTFADLVLSVLPWPFHKDLPKAGPTGPCRTPTETLGMFCSLSIPIVTLCALILLMIMVNLFDIFFRWIPYLFVCLPIPGFKGKK